MKTKEKIVATALKMFNEQGERKVTTNHIAAELGISPGNLYYHFSNKQEIICSIFIQYEQALKAAYSPKNEQLLTIEAIKQYMNASFELMWQFRFLYVNLLELLNKDPALAERYHQVQQDLVSWSENIILQLREHRYLVGEDEDMKELAHSLRFIIGSWVSYQSAQTLAPLNKAQLYQGVLKALFAIRPYFNEQAMATYQQLHRYYSELASK